MFMILFSSFGFLLFSMLFNSFYCGIFRWIVFESIVLVSLCLVFYVIFEGRVFFSGIWVIAFFGLYRVSFA